jgi:hypothetical protein
MHMTSLWPVLVFPTSPCYPSFRFQTTFIGMTSRRQENRQTSLVISFFWLELNSRYANNVLGCGPHVLSVDRFYDAL